MKVRTLFRHFVFITMFLDNIFYNNTVQEWLLSILSIMIIFIGMVLLKKLLYRQINAIAQKTSTEWDDLVAELIGRTKWVFLLIIAVYVGFLTISLPPRFADLLRKLAIIAFLIQGAIWGSYLLTFGLDRYKKQKIEKDAAAVTTFISLGFILRIILWSIIVLLALDNLGVDITALVAGLGVTGIAVALAVQNILGDLFASLSIVLDKPFVIGDFIIIDSFLGTIEHIGLKTTRIRSLSGEQLVFSNNDLLTSRIRNYKRMYERRVVFSIGVIYQTPPEKLKMIPEIIREIIEAQDLVRFDRAHFKEYGDYALTFEIVYWIQSPDYNLYMDIQQAINLEIYQRFKQQAIEFAYPTQLLYYHHAPASPAPVQEQEESGEHPKEHQTKLSQGTLHIVTKRAYAQPEQDDGIRILVDRSWPPGIKKEDLQIDRWLKEIAPSTSLRKWFGHDPKKWTEFKKRYFQELEEKREVVEQVLEIASKDNVTLVFMAKNESFNSAVALKEYVENIRDELGNKV